VVAFERVKKMELQKLGQEMKKVDDAMANVRQREADNWLENTRITTDRDKLENEAAIIKRDNELLATRERQVMLHEDQRRRNRFVSS
jgi:hypothetical protein